MLQMKDNSPSRKQTVKIRLKNRSFKKEHSRKKEKEWVANKEPSSMKPSITEFTKIDGNTTSYSMNGIEANARLRVDQHADYPQRWTANPEILRDTGSVNYYQFLITKKLVSEVLRSLRGEFGKHPGIAKTILAYREKYYYPNIAQLIREGIMSCAQRIGESQINRRLARSPLQNPNEHITVPEDASKLIWCRNCLRPLAFRI